VTHSMRRDFEADLPELGEVAARIEAAHTKLLTTHVPGAKSRSVTQQPHVTSVHEFADFLSGKRVLIGGEVYNHVFERLEQAFQCNLFWCEVSKTATKMSFLLVFAYSPIILIPLY
jgi:hypothetical protein